MRKLIFLVLVMMGCGGVSMPQLDFAAQDAKTLKDTIVDATKDTYIDATMPDPMCLHLVIGIGYQAEKCFDDIVDFWMYMDMLEEIPCERLAAGDYPRAC